MPRIIYYPLPVASQVASFPGLELVANQKTDIKQELLDTLMADAEFKTCVERGIILIEKDIKPGEIAQPALIEDTEVTEEVVKPKSSRSR